MNKRVVVCGKPFLRPIRKVIATPILESLPGGDSEEQHSAVGKETGETAHVERWNNTLRQRLARFVRKTLSFSKSLFMHDACLNLFLHRYNLERAAILI